MRALASFALALALIGCSIFDKPDPSRLDGGRSRDDVGVDGGVDTGIDAASFDGGIDGGDAAMCAHLSEGMCGDGRDDDCDGLIDCADPDCVVHQDPACCVSGTSAVTETFTKSAGIWTTASNWTAPASMSNAISSNALVEMGSGPLIGMVNTTCLHVDLGTELRFAFTASPCTGTDCDGRMEVVLGPSAMFNGMLTDDLAVRGIATEGGPLRIEVVQGGSVRRSSTMPFGTLRTDVTITLSPGLARGMPAIVATVVATQGVLREELATQIYVTDRDIFGTSTCHGLHLGVQGVGRHVALDDVRIAQLDCSNPAHFTKVRDDAASLDATTMSVFDSTHMTGWGSGGIGDPALFEGAFGPAAPRGFTLLYDGSTFDRSTETFAHLPLSIGGADTRQLSMGEPVLVDDCSLWQPRGSHVAACTAQPMASGNSIIESALVMRDPTLYPSNRNAASIDSFLVAWVGETTPGSGLVLYDTTLAPALTTRIGALPDPTPIENESCLSIRNPLLLPLVGGDANQWLVFYVCERTVFPPVVHAAVLSTGGTSSAQRILDLELGPTQLGSLAQLGVIDIAGVVFEYAGAPTYRLWLVTRPTTMDTAVLYVEGSPPMASTDHIPSFTSFAGNPVLTENSPVFGSCMSGCQLHGITATRISDDPTRVRLLVDRWVTAGAGETYSLIPLEQVWPRDHP